MFLYRARSFHRSLRMQSMTLGLFTGMCYSHQTGLVKSQHVVLLPKHRGESEHQTDNLYLFHCQFTFRPSSWHPLPPTPPPTVSFFLTPHKSYCIWVTTAFNSLSALNDSAWCLAQRVCLSSIQLVSRGSLPACLRPEWPHMKARNQATTWDQMFYLGLANWWCPHTDL